MSDLKTTLIAFMRGEGKLDAVDAALGHLLARHPEKADQVGTMLRKARDAGLDQRAFTVLESRRVTLAAPPPADDDGLPGTVVLSTSPLRTGARPVGDALSGALDPDRTLLAEADRTVFADDADRTLLATGERAGAEPMPPAGGGEDSTEVNAGAAGGDAARRATEDRTVTEPRARPHTGSAPASEDRTEVNAGPGDEDVTEVDFAGSAPEERVTEVGDQRPLAGAGPEDATEVGADSAREDSTAVNFGGEDATAVNVVGAGYGAATDPIGGDRTEVSPGGPTATGQPGTGGSWPTNLPGAASSGPGVDRDFREGDLLRGRFQLISKLGEGGMGAVWKGLDKLKEEAKDRNPYVAIKLLQGDFKEHPEAFIALQRETSKQQRLAHPNIATVYDFDRDDVSSTVFMTMEVLEGQPLDQFVRRLPADGLPEEEAKPLIEQLCAGLAYAHSHGLVHSDLKPGNCFLTDEGTIKLLDFGIARASKTKGDLEGETTLFDPGELGALTPTYATLEMFDGQDPDPRDDIYALGIMAYQLFTGKHPYGKKSAPKALELGLRPEPVAKLDKRQNRGMVRAIQIHRDDRTPTVEAFVDDITRKKNRTPVIAAAAFALFVLVGAALTPTIITYLDQQAREEVVAVFQGGDWASIESALAKVASLEDQEQARLVLEDRRTLAALGGYLTANGRTGGEVEQALAAIRPFDDGWEQDVRDAAQDRVIQLYEDKVATVFDPDGGQYDYAAAERLYAELGTLYKDSARVQSLAAATRSVRNETVNDLTRRFDDLLQAGRLMPAQDTDDIGDVLAVLARIDPEHRKLSDPLVALRYGDLAQAQIEAGNFEAAQAVLDGSAMFRGSDVAPLASLHALLQNDKNLNDLRYQVRSELQRVADARRITEIEQRLQGVVPRLRSLSDFQEVRDDLVVLADLSPDNELLKRIQSRLKAAFGEDLAAHVKGGRFDAAEELLLAYAKLMEVPFLTERRVELSRAEAAAGHRQADTPEMQATIDARVAAVESLLETPEFTTDWEIRLKGPYKELLAMLPGDSVSLDPVRDRIARLYLERASAAREQGSFAEATSYVNRGRDFYPTLPAFEQEVSRIAGAREAERLRREEEKRFARIENLKNNLREAAARNDVKEAEVQLGLLASERLGAGDDFAGAEAPKLIGAAYQRLAAERFEQNDFTNALALGRRASELDASLAGLAKSLERYQAEADKRAAVTEVDRALAQPGALDAARVSAAMKRVERDLPDEYDGHFGRWAQVRAGVIDELANAKRPDLGALATLLAEHGKLFPERADAVRDAVVKQVEARIDLLPRGNAQQLATLSTPLAQFKALSVKRHGALTKRYGDALARQIGELESKDKAGAAALLASARTALPESDALARMKIVLPLPELVAARKDMEAGRLSRAAELVAAARSKNAAHPDIAPLEERLAARKEEAVRAYREYSAAAAKARYTEQKRYDATLGKIVAAWRDHGGEFKRIEIRVPRKGECDLDLAGLGAKRGGRCYDIIGRKRGPELVVVPASGSIGPFAIGHTEVTVGDLKLFCAATSRCKSPLGRKPKLPATGVSIQEAEAYAEWLSEEASKTENRPVRYRLPNKQEWEYAAKANGATAAKNVNCRVVANGAVIAGYALVAATTGAANGWGLVNSVGNAQEWVRSGADILALGGAFEDSLAKCEVSLERRHSGQADPVTGFRLVRELG